MKLIIILIPLILLAACVTTVEKEVPFIIYKNHTVYVNQTVYVNASCSNATNTVYYNRTSIVGVPCSQGNSSLNFALIRRLKMLEAREQYYLNTTFEEKYLNCTDDLANAKEEIVYLNDTC